MNTFFKNQFTEEKVKVWVLAPYLITNDPNIDYYYDFSQSILEYTKAFTILGLPWKWQAVTLNNYQSIIDSIITEKNNEHYTAIILNLCDGDEVNGTPGISVLKYLEEKDLIYTGADEYFYDITTSKVSMKKAFDEYGVSHAKWISIQQKNQQLNGSLRKLGFPIIVKPAVSGGSMGVGIKNVVTNNTELNEQVNKLFEGYRGWKLTVDGIVAEEFIVGPEFTTLIVGSYDRPEEAVIYPPVERVFHPSLPDNEKFLSFDRLWEIYEDETPMPKNENFYEYTTPHASLHETIKKISWDAYCAVKGQGYSRVDLRMNARTGNIYVLEVNAQCGLSEDENYTSIGAILRLSNTTFAQLIAEILQNAYARKVNA